VSQTTQWAIGIAVAILVALPALVLQLRAERRRQVAYWVNSTELLARRASEVSLEVRVDGQEIADPRLVRVHFVSHGHLDIPSAAFDQGRPVTFDLGTPVRQLVNASGIAADDFVVLETSIQLQPHLIKAGARYDWDLICDGPASVNITAPLIDTTVMNPADAYFEGGKRERPVSWAVTGVGVALLAVGLLNIDFESRQQPDYGWPNYVFGAGFVVMAFVVPFLWTFGWRRDKRAAMRLLAPEMNSRLAGSDGFD
jgi:hypothetical protein